MIWDGAASHRGKEMAKLPFVRIFQPPYSPELNPVGCSFEELRQVAEGRIYVSMEAKQEAVERKLRQLAADPVAVKRLAGWDWLCQALSCLPES